MPPEALAKPRATQPSKQATNQFYKKIKKGLLIQPPLLIIIIIAPSFLSFLLLFPPHLLAPPLQPPTPLQAPNPDPDRDQRAGRRGDEDPKDEEAAQQTFPEAEGGEAGQGGQEGFSKGGAAAVVWFWGCWWVWATTGRGQGGWVDYWVSMRGVFLFLSSYVHRCMDNWFGLGGAGSCV